MLADALYNTLKTILTAYPVIGAPDAAAPFCTYAVEPTPIRTKDGIVGYTQKVRIAIVDDDIDAIETNSNSIRAAITSLDGTTTDSTIINMVLLNFESGSIFNQDFNIFQNTLEFTFDTDTR
jgi:hypothetical protein